MTLSFGPTPLLHDCFELCKENTLQPRWSRQMHRYQNSCLRATSNCHVCKDLITAITPMLRFRLYSGEVSCLEAQISLSAEWQRSCGALLAKNCLDRTTSFFLYFFGRVGEGGGSRKREDIAYFYRSHWVFSCGQLRLLFPLKYKQTNNNNKNFDRVVLPSLINP